MNVYDQIAFTIAAAILVVSNPQACTSLFTSHHEIWYKDGLKGWNIHQPNNQPSNQPTNQPNLQPAIVFNHQVDAENLEVPESCQHQTFGGASWI